MGGGGGHLSVQPEMFNHFWTQIHHKYRLLFIKQMSQRRNSNSWCFFKRPFLGWKSFSLADCEFLCLVCLVSTPFTFTNYGTNQKPKHTKMRQANVAVQVKYFHTQQEWAMTNWITNNRMTSSALVPISISYPVIHVRDKWRGLDKGQQL